MKQNLIPTQVYVEFTAKTVRGLIKEKEAKTFQKRIKEHKRDFKSGNLSNA